MQTFTDTAKTTASPAANLSQIKNDANAIEHEVKLQSSLFFQPKLTVGSADDPLEKEADEMADKVMRMEKPGIQLKSFPVTSVQRKCAHCEEEEEKQLQRKENSSDSISVAPPIVHDVIKSSSGKPLDADTRSFMEPRFNYDFSNVKIHDNSIAAKSASSVNALAYTSGSNVVFNSGQYNTSSDSGKRLLAHELTHVMQQREGKEHNNLIQRACGTSISTSIGCTPGAGEPVGDLVLFKINCDDFSSPAEQQKVEDFADSMSSTDLVNIHGFASPDGVASFNEILSCARANKASDILIARGIQPAQITEIQHGPTPGSPVNRRSVVLERNPGLTRPVVPQLNAAISIGPTPLDCGSENFQTQWSINRNSGPNGGFVIQELTISWDKADCAGNALPNIATFTSPLTYFEAWRVLPNSTNFDPSTTNFDNFNFNNKTACSVGNLFSFHGRAIYFDNVAALPAHMIPGNPATAAGSLPSSLTDPALVGDSSRPVEHNLEFHWNCCPCQSSPTIIDSNTP